MSLKCMGVSKCRGTPKSSILIGFFIINHPFWGTIIFGNTRILVVTVPFLIRPGLSLNRCCFMVLVLWIIHPSLPSETSLNELRIQVSLSMGWQHLSCLSCDTTSSSSAYTPGSSNIWKIHVDGIYQEHWGFSMAMLVYRRAHKNWIEMGIQKTYQCQWLSMSYNDMRYARSFASTSSWN